jgi:putative membrane protein
MLRQTKWLVALAAALGAAPGFAQAGSSGPQTSGEKGAVQGSTNPTAEPGRGGSGAKANSAQTGSPETMGSGSTETGSNTQEQRTQQGTSDTTTDETKAKAMGQQASSHVARTLAKLHAGNESEIEAGTWMKEHATNDRVKDFAKKMVDDHGSMDKDLMSFAQKQGIELTSAPTAGEAAKAKDKASLDEIKNMQGAQADRTYMRMMVQDHTKDVKEARSAEQQAKRSKDTEFAKLLDKSAKKMESHLKDAQKIQRDLSQRQARTPSSQ